MSPEKVKEYCLNDARLTMDLSKVGDIDKKTKVAKLDGKLLDLMIALSERLNMPFTNVCHFGMSSMWHKVFREMGSRESDPLYLPNKIFPERRVKGAYVKDPEPGLYENVAVLDVASLYPTIMVKHNISFDTVCCECCRTNPAAKVPEDILPGGFWICKRKEGAVAQKIRQFREERLQHKRAGRKIMSDGIKILMNAMYGLFGNEFFEYADYRAANLVTAFGRSYIFKIIETAEKLGHKVLYSDTDSIFILQGTGPIDGIIEAVESELEGVELEHEKTYRKLLLTKKKHYIGLKVDDDPVVSGMEGEKNDRPQWIRETFAQFVRDFDADINPKTLLKASWEEFKEGQIPLEQLRFSIKLSKNGDQYEKGSQQNKLAMLAGAKAGDVIDYFKTPNGPSLQVQNFSELDFAAYKDTFESTFEDALSMLGIQISEIFEGHEQETLDTLFWRTTTA
jgi:DNA polymerase I